MLDCLRQLFWLKSACMNTECWGIVVSPLKALTHRVDVKPRPFLSSTVGNGGPLSAAFLADWECLNLLGGTHWDVTVDWLSYLSESVLKKRNVSEQSSKQLWSRGPHQLLMATFYQTCSWLEVAMLRNCLSGMREWWENTALWIVTMVWISAVLDLQVSPFKWQIYTPATRNNAPLTYFFLCRHRTYVLVGCLL